MGQSQTKLFPADQEARVNNDFTILSSPKPTLRLYEREGLLTPSRSEGNTRLYTDEELERLEIILTLAAAISLMPVIQISSLSLRMDGKHAVAGKRKGK